MEAQLLTCGKGSTLHMLYVTLYGQVHALQARSGGARQSSKKPLESLSHGQGYDLIRVGFSVLKITIQLTHQQAQPSASQTHAFRWLALPSKIAPYALLRINSLQAGM